MGLSEVIGVEIPDPDGQYRLLPCSKCKGENVEYVLLREFAGDKWLVRCCDCEHILSNGYDLKHDAQLAWNKENRDA